MLLRHLVATFGSASIGSATPSSVTKRPPSMQSDTSPQILDSRTSFHMTFNSSSLSSLHLVSPTHIITADSTSLSIAGRSTLSTSSFSVPSVARVPQLTMQLMSAGQLTDNGCCVILDFDSCCVQNHHTCALVGTNP